MDAVGAADRRRFLVLIGAFLQCLEQPVDVGHQDVG
jgi:hypothetical protein